MLPDKATAKAVARHPELAALRDSYTMEFLGLSDDHSEMDLRRSVTPPRAMPKTDVGTTSRDR